MARPLAALAVPVVGLLAALTARGADAAWFALGACVLAGLVSALLLGMARREAREVVREAEERAAALVRDAEARATALMREAWDRAQAMEVEVLGLRVRQAGLLRAQRAEAEDRPAEPPPPSTSKKRNRG